MNERVEYEKLIPEIQAMLQQEEGHPESNIESFPDLLERGAKKEIPKGITLIGWDAFNKATDGLRPHEFSILCGPTGCLGGETLIPINRAGKGSTITIRELYLRTHNLAQGRNYEPEVPTYVRSYNGLTVSLHKIRNVHISGVKETKRYRFAQNIDLRLTACHRILTRSGWVPAGQLMPGDLVAKEDKYAKASGRVRPRRYDPYVFGANYHPFSIAHPDGRRIVLHRAAYEAHTNGLTLDEFKAIIKTDKVRSSTLIYVNPKTHHVHHKDHNYKNNDPLNLESISIAEHMKHHGNAGNFNQGNINWLEFIESDKPGTEATYDIECEDPHHNFVANGIVVHNSGKTTLLANMYAILVGAGVPAFAAPVEVGGESFARAVFSIMQGCHKNAFRGKWKEINTSQKALFYSNENMLISKYQSRVNHMYLLADLLHAYRTRGTKVALLDNLNYMLHVRKGESPIEVYDEVIHDWVVFLKHVPIHVWMVMHPKKTDSMRVEHEGDIKGSSTAIQEAQNVFLFNRLKDQFKAPSGVEPFWCREVKIAKCRENGKMWGQTIMFSLDKVSEKYEERGFV